MTTIAVDAMGGDHAPGPEVAGAVAAVRDSDVRVMLVGDERRVRLELERAGASRHPRIEIVHASQVVLMEDTAAQAFRAKHDSSMRVAFDRVVAGEAHAVVSAGNSGALLGHGVFLLKRLPGVERPAIVTTFPTPHGHIVLCDVGANVDVKPSMLAQFGVLGACYDRVLYKTARPRVGLLSNGAEQSKGTGLTREAHRLLAAAAAGDDAELAYVGYVEGSSLFHGVCDVVATDGFTGNVVLKVSEGVAEAMFRMIKAQLEATVRGRIAGALGRPSLGALRKTVDASEAGGALLLGVDGVVMICHGGADAPAIKNAIKASDQFVRDGLIGAIGAAISRHDQLWRREPAA